MKGIKVLLGNSIKFYWHQVLNLGIHQSLSPDEVLKVKLVNKLAVFAILTSIFLLLIVRIYLGLGSPWRNVLTISIIVFILYFNHLRKFYIARHLICFGFSTYLAIGYYAGDLSIALMNILMIIAFLTFVLYEDKPRLRNLNLGYIFLIGISSHISMIIDPIGINYSEKYFDYVTMFLATFLILALTVFFYQSDIAALQSDNNELLNELKSKNSELERFAYVTSHDLKEPVRNIGSFAKVLEKQIDDPEQFTKNKEIIGLVQMASNKMTSLIDSILNFSKIDAEDFFSEKVDLNQVILEFKTSHEDYIRSQKAVVEFNGLPTLNGNRIFLSLLFQNLLQNAIEYNDSERPHVKISGEKKMDNYEIIVSDNGVGIDKEYHNYIFEPFKKLANNLILKGSGLGLSICKKVVEHHGGSISIRSEEGKGSNFIIVLPQIV